MATYTWDQVYKMNGVNPNDTQQVQDFNSQIKTAGVNGMPEEQDTQSAVPIQPKMSLFSSKGLNPKSDSLFSKDVANDNQKLIKGASFLAPIGGDIPVPQGKNSYAAKAYDQVLQQHSDLAGQLNQKIAETKASGGDSSKLENALQQLNQSVPNRKDFNNHASPEKVLGDAILTGINAAALISAPLTGGASLEGAGAIEGGLGAAEGLSTVAKIGQGALTGAKVGGAYGAGQGLGQGLSNEGSATDVLKSTAEGGLIGAASGGVLGGGIAGAPAAIEGAGKIANSIDEGFGNIGEAFKGGLNGFSNTPEGRSKYIESLVTPKLTSKVTEAAIKTGKVSESTGLFGSRRFTEAIPNIKNIQAEVERVPGVSPTNTLLENSNAIHDEIGNIAEDLKSQLQGKGSFTPNEFNKYMNQVKSELADNPLLVGDAEKTAQKIINKFNKIIKEEGYTPEGLLEGRKKLDQWMGSQKGNVFNPSTESAVSTALRAIRQGGNDFLAEHVPDVAVKEMLLKQSHLYQAIDNIAPKATQEGNNKVMQLLNSKLGRNIQAVAPAIGIGGGLLGGTYGIAKAASGQ